MIKTLVIGGGGYIGSYLVPLLVAEGRHVTVLGRSKRPHNSLPEEVTYIAGDYSELGAITCLLDCHHEVINLAYATVPNTSNDSPLSDLLDNLPPAVQLFSEIASRGIKLVMVSSGGTVYGDALNLPISEEHQTKPISPYGLTKLTQEYYANLFSVTRGLRFICLRPSNAYGVGQRPFSGQGFISTAIASAYNRMPVKIFGEKGCIRDYLYVSDLASGIVAALLNGKLSETYNIGTGVGLSNFDIICIIRKILAESNVDIDIQSLPDRSFDVKSNILSSQKLTSHTGWKSHVCIEDGLRMTCAWLKVRSS